MQCPGSYCAALSPGARPIIISEEFREGMCLSFPIGTVKPLSSNRADESPVAQDKKALSRESQRQSHLLSPRSARVWGACTRRGCCDTFSLFLSSQALCICRHGPVAPGTVMLAVFLLLSG